MRSSHNKNEVKSTAFKKLVSIKSSTCQKRKISKFHLECLKDNFSKFNSKRGKRVKKKVRNTDMYFNCMK